MSHMLLHTLLAEMAVMIWLCITARLLLCVQGCLWHILNMRRISCKVLGAAAVLQSLSYECYVTPTLLQQPPSLLTAHCAAVPLPAELADACSLFHYVRPHTDPLVHCIWLCKHPELFAKLEVAFSGRLALLHCV